MKYNHFLYLTIATVCLLISPFASSNLAIDRIIIDFTKDTPQQNDVRLINTSETETLFVSVEVLEVEAPGTSEETHLIADDPFKIGLIASPNRLIIPPGTNRLVRLVNLFPADDEERIFRVNFTPVAGEQDEDENTLRLLVGYQALVIVRPNNPTFDVVGERNGNTLTLKNKGNTNVYLDTFRQCTDEELSDCEAIAETRLYPGNIRELELMHDGPVAFYAIDGSESHPMTF